MILVLGAGGMLGKDVLRAFGDKATGLARAACDIADPTHIAKLGMGEFGRPNWIINCAAYTKVDLAEEEKQAAYDANALGPSYLSSAAADLSARVIHISTDFVFDGSKTSPYAESDDTSPLNEYGRTKLAGEQNIAPAIVLRTSWLFGAEGPCFPKTMIRVASGGKPLRVVADQIGCPTYTEDLAQTIVRVIEANLPDGIYHATGHESMSWFDFAKRAVSAAGILEADISPIQTEDWPTPAARPKYSVLSNEKLIAAGIPKMPNLDSALRRFTDRLNQPEPTA